MKQIISLERVSKRELEYSGYIKVDPFSRSDTLRLVWEPDDDGEFVGVIPEIEQDSLKRFFFLQIGSDEFRYKEPLEILTLKTSQAEVSLQDVFAFEVSASVQGNIMIVCDVKKFFEIISALLTDSYYTNWWYSFFLFYPEVEKIKEIGHDTKQRFFYISKYTDSQVFVHGVHQKAF